MSRPESGLVGWRERNAGRSLTSRQVRWTRRGEVCGRTGGTGGIDAPSCGRDHLEDIDPHGFHRWPGAQGKPALRPFRDRAIFLLAAEGVPAGACAESKRQIVPVIKGFRFNAVYDAGASARRASMYGVDSSRRLPIRNTKGSDTSSSPAHQRGFRRFSRCLAELVRNTQDVMIHGSPGTRRGISFFPRTGDSLSVRTWAGEPTGRLASVPRNHALLNDSDGITPARQRASWWP